MEKANSGFDCACGWTKFNLDLLGIWPDINSSGIRKYYPLIHASLCLIFLFLPRIIAVFLFWHETDALIQCFSSFIPLSIGYIKLLVLYFQKQVLGEFLNRMEIDWTSMSAEQYEAVMRFTQIGRRISIVSISIAYVTTSVGVLAQKIYNLERFYISDPDPRLTLNLFWVVYLPYDTSNTITYVISLVLQFYTSCICAIIYSTFDALVVMMIFHLCGQLELIKMSIYRLASDNRTKEKFCFQRALKNTVKKHVELIRLAKSLKEALNFVYLLTLLAFTLTMCFAGYTIIKVLDGGEINYFPIAFAVSITCDAGMQFFFICWASHFLITQSTAVGHAIYNSDWTELTCSESRVLMLIGFKIFRPLELTTGKFATLSLPLFLKAIKTSMSFLSVLLAVQTSDKQ